MYVCRDVAILRQVTNGDHRQSAKLNEFRNQIRKRIDQLDQFYDLHCYDTRVALFHRLKLQLMKALENHLTEDAAVGVVTGRNSISSGQTTLVNLHNKSPISKDSLKPLPTEPSSGSLNRTMQTTKNSITRENFIDSQKSSKPNTLHSS
jgi:hypothetical protein